MLIVCPNCAIVLHDRPGRGRRRPGARCVARAARRPGSPAARRTSPTLTAFVDDVIAEAEARAAGAGTRRSAAARRAPTQPEPPTIPAPNLPSRPPQPRPKRRRSSRRPANRVPDRSARRSSRSRLAIADAPSLVPPIEHEPLPEAADAELDSEEVESFDARRLRLQARRKKPRRSSRWTAVILVLVAFNVALVGARNEVVRYLPQTASLFAAIGLPVNLRGLKFENVRISQGRPGRRHHADRRRRRSSAKPASRSKCRACALPRATPPVRKSTPGPRRRRAAFSVPARRLAIPQPARLAAGRRQRRDGALLHRAGRRRRSEISTMAKHPDRRRRRRASAIWSCARSTRTATT